MLVTDEGGIGLGPSIDPNGEGALPDPPCFGNTVYPADPCLEGRVDHAALQRSLTIHAVDEDTEQTAAE